MARCPKTTAEAFKRLDKRLTKEEKQQIVDSDSMSEFHFSLGMWIRNYWIYTGERENLAMLLTDLGEKVTSVGEGDEKFYFIMPPDMVSGIILEAYQKHLKDSIGI
jgi:hypothetical protein